jgi:transketolase
MKNTDLHLADHELPTQDTTRDGFGIGLVELAESTPAVVGLCADLTESTRMHWFAKAYPKRFIQMGVAEENMVGVATGLALAGKIPFASSYACFSPANSWGVIRSSLCYSKLPVIIVGGHAGLSTGADGATHQALEDIAIMRVLPNMTVIVPCDKEEARKATHALATLGTPAYLRTSKLPATTLTTTKTPFEIGVGLVLQTGADIALIACGTMVSKALETARHLARKDIHATVINMHTIKPLDTALLDTLTRTVRAVLTIEDHQKSGGLGSAVAEYLAQLPTHPPLAIMGTDDVFGQSGTPAELYREYGLTTKDIARTALKLLE